MRKPGSFCMCIRAVVFFLIGLFAYQVFFTRENPFERVHFTFDIFFNVYLHIYIHTYIGRDRL